MKEGVVQAALDERVTIWKLNIGPSESILVTNDTVQVNSTLHHFMSSGGTKIVKTITGGVEGDLLVLTGHKVKLAKGGNININSKIRLKENKAILFVYINTLWTRIN